MRGLRFPSWTLTAAVLMTLAASASAGTPGRWTLTHQPVRIVNGAPVLLRAITPQPVRRLSGKWFGHEISFNFDEGRKAWFALAGASLETKPGAYPIELEAETVSGKLLTYQQPIKVQRQSYPRAILKVPGRYTAPSPEELRKIEQDKEIKEEAFKTLSADRKWKGNFIRPVAGAVSGVFGVQRVFNGTVQSTHQGLDFRVPAGTSVAAVNGGRVILAGSLFYEGNCVVIDHGQGLLTLYLHLSKILVREGDIVEKSQPIALSGGTGRATGPHLHLAARWQGVYLNPAGLLSLRLP
jgi:murein DD-endopeptidase MepM/ murein hydrolase activator NlpD